MKKLLKLLAGICICLAAVQATAASRPNVVVILIDDLGFGDLSCAREWGYRATVPDRDAARREALLQSEQARYPRTRCIDRLAEEGTLFTQFYVASPVCSPSRVGLVTGQYPSRSRIVSFLASREKNREKGMPDFLDPAAPSLARQFQAAGYATGHVGKWHLGGGRDVDDAPLPQAYGFMESLTSFEGLGDRLLPPGPLSDQNAQLGHGTFVRVEHHELTPKYVDRCVEFIQHHRDRPFFLQFWLTDVHDAHVPAPGREAAFESSTENPFERKFFPVLEDMDREIGRLIDAIDAAGVGDNTIVLLTSDNGPTAWPRYARAGVAAPGSTAGFRGRKWSLYEGGIRMPLIARWPGHIPAGRVDTTSVLAAVDLVSTLCDLTGINPPDDPTDGETAGPALLGHLWQRTQPLFWDYGRFPGALLPAHPEDRSPELAVRDGRWKLLVNSDGGRLELYALGEQGEIDERENVAADHPETASRLQQAVMSWRDSLPDTTPEKSP